MTTKAGIVQLALSTNRKLGRKRGDRHTHNSIITCAKDPHHLRPATGSPPESHKQSHKTTQLQNAFNGLSATPPMQGLTSFPLWTEQRPLITTTPACTITRMQPASLTDVASPHRGTSRGSNVTPDGGTPTYHAWPTRANYGDVTNLRQWNLHICTRTHCTRDSGHTHKLNRAFLALQKKNGPDSSPQVLPSTVKDRQRNMYM